ncbi:MAG: E3 binding domain-containing protein [Planctomycetota bacterium]|jgi:pyruvate dehydrogenase E2 component (dihydrolipoamide acetyltransferase)
MATAVMMPQVGQDIETAVIVEWLKKENDPVQKGDAIASVESDKATFDVEAYESGVLLKILHDEGAEVPVLTPIAYIGQPGEEVVEIPEAAPHRVAGILPAIRGRDALDNAEPPQKHSGPAASPSARRLAKEKGIDLQTVTGTGPGGRITKEDVLNATDK